MAFVRRLADLKWVIAGVGLGALLGWTRQSPEQPLGADHIYPRDFEELLLQAPPAGMAMMRNLVVRRVGPHYLVTGEKLTVVKYQTGEWRYDPFRVILYTPFKAEDAESPPLPAASATALDLLAATRKYNPKLNYQYAWWTEPWVTVTSYAAVGGLVAGVFGLTRPKRAAVAGADALTAIVMSPAAESGPSPSPAEPEDDQRPAVALPPLGGPAEANVPAIRVSPVALAGEQVRPAAPAAVEGKEYAGDYYPTVVHKHDVHDTKD